MHSPAATAASQNGHWNAVETMTLTVTPWVIVVGSVLVVEPDRGMFRLTMACMTAVKPKRMTTKNSRLASGL